MYIDNFCTSLRLAKCLTENGTNATGTIRENRKQFPLELKNTSLQKGEAAFYQHKSIVIVKYRAKKGIVLEGNLKWYMSYIHHRELL